MSKYIRASRVGYVDLTALETEHGKIMADTIAKLASASASDNNHGNEIHCGYEFLADAIEEQANRFSPEQIQFLQSFQDTCRAINCTGDLIFFK